MTYRRIFCCIKRRLLSKKTFQWNNLLIKQLVIDMTNYINWSDGEVMSWWIQDWLMKNWWLNIRLMKRHVHKMAVLTNLIPVDEVTSRWIDGLTKRPSTKREGLIFVLNAEPSWLSWNWQSCKDSKNLTQKKIERNGTQLLIHPILLIQL